MTTAVSVPSTLFGHAMTPLNDSHADHTDNNSINNSDDGANISINVSDIDYIYDRWLVQKTTESVAVPVIFGFIFIVGLVGNGTLIISVLANKVGLLLYW